MNSQPYMRAQLWKLLSFVLLTILSAQSFACSVSKEPALSEKFAAAGGVALVKIISTRLIVDNSKKDEWERETVEATYEVLEAFKGDHSRPVIREMVFGPGNCTVPLLTGNMYFLFIQKENGTINWTTRSEMIWNIDGDNVKPILAELS